MARNLARAFTLIELLVVIAVIAILATIAYPVYTGVIERARVTQDMNNLRQIGLGIQTYLNDNDQVLPATTTWPGTTATPVLYPKYIATRKVFQSPFDKRSSLETDLAPVSYSINANMYAVAPGINRNMTSVVSPASTILMAPNYPNPPGNPTNVLSWPGTATSAPNLLPGGTGETRGTHSNGTRINALFCDFHTESLTFSLTGPPYPAGTFQDTTSNPLGLKHWDPTK
jgi:prepilin-type N-terminal cleavage/methylation domain-containing protein/prepilin-type processing-associated H-X9-DG protein